MNYYRNNSHKYGKYYRKFVDAKKDYSDFVRAQSSYPIYKQYVEDYNKEVGSKCSEEFYIFLANLSVFYGIEHEERYFQFIKKSFQYFSVDEEIDKWNSEWKRNELLKLWIEKETGRKEEKERKKYLKELLSHKDDDDDDNNNNSDNNDEDEKDEDNNYSYNNTHSNYSYSHSNYSSSHSNTTHDININKKTSSNNSNQKKKVKVIVCYACKSKDKCPLCGNKMQSKVSLGNMYAHTDCYNEGKCCLCGKKGPGNQVQSICSNCRKGPSSKGLTGSARCFICRQLIK